MTIQIGYGTVMTVGCLTFKVKSWEITPGPKRASERPYHNRFNWRRRSLAQLLVDEYPWLRSRN